MPKRVPTPPPGDDEPRYLTVVHPYAINGTCNMELPKDRQDFARWVACCIDKDVFFAIYHKPSSRGMVIIEVNRDYAHFDRILGEHRWAEFLQKPTEEEGWRVTQVFYCTYNTGRIVQKNGWKRIDVDEAWFKTWSPRNRNIMFPYPATHFCDVPVEDQTNHSMCRPLPGAVKETPVEVIAAPQPVVGSAAWIQTKKGGSSPTPITTQTKPKSAWDKGAPKAQATSAKPHPIANGSVKKTVGISQGPYTGTRVPAVGGGPISVKSSHVWQNMGKKPASSPAVTNWDESAPVSRENTPVSRVISPATTQQAPPGLPARRNAWESGATSYPIHPPGLILPGNAAASVAQGAPERAGNISTSCWDSTGNSTSSPDSDSGPDLTTVTESDNPYAIRIHFSESMEEEFHGMGIRPIEDEGDFGELDSIAPGPWETTTAAAWETTDETGWGNDVLEAEDQWKQNQEPAQPMLCKAHGVICKKGICAEYAKQVRLAKRAEEAEKRKTASANRGKKGGRAKGRGAGKKKDEDEDESFERRKTQNNAFRGPGAPVKTNWRGAPRAIVSADAIEKREMTKAASDDGWGVSDSEVEPKAGTVVADGTADAASDASWGVPGNAYDPWAATPQPVAKAKGSGSKPLGKKKPGQTTVSSNWADQVDAELAATGGDSDKFSVVSSKRGSKRGASTTSWGTSTAKSSTSGWGNVPDMPW